MGCRKSDAWEPYKPPAPPRDAESAPASAPPRAAAGQEDEAALWRRWRGHAEAAAQERLAQRYLPFARAVAARIYATRRHQGIEFDEYAQFAVVGLMQSLARYAPERGTRFTTFAMPRIRGAILDGVDRLTERHQQIAFRRRLAAERAASFVRPDLSPDPTARLLADLEEIGVGVAIGFLLEGTGMVVGPGEALPEGVYAGAQSGLDRLHRQLWEMVDRLTGREREVIEMHYRDAMRFEEIARTLRLSKGRVSQLHRQAVMRLRSLAGKSQRCDVAY